MGNASGSPGSILHILLGFRSASVLFSEVLFETDLITLRRNKGLRYGPIVEQYKLQIGNRTVSIRNTEHPC